MKDVLLTREECPEIIKHHQIINMRLQRKAIFQDLPHESASDKEGLLNDFDFGSLHVLI